MRFLETKPQPATPGFPPRAVSTVPFLYHSAQHRGRRALHVFVEPVVQSLRADTLGGGNILNRFGAGHHPQDMNPP